MIFQTQNWSAVVITISQVFFRCTFCITQPLLSLPVPGLAEKRPSLFIGETNLMDVVLQPSHARYSSRWSHFCSGAGSSSWSLVRGIRWGHVPFAHKAEMGLRFYRSFRRYSESTTFHICFRLNRIPLPSLKFLVQRRMGFVPNKTTPISEAAQSAGQITGR
jgi:hypothetical protein